MATRCPERHEITDYALGKLGGAEDDEVASHVADCPTCRAMLETVRVGDDPLVSRLRDPAVLAGSDPYEHEAACRVAVERAAGILPHKAPYDAATVVGRIRDYRLLEEIGGGGMGTVYKALHERLGKVVAVKVLAPRHVRDPQSLARFTREMRAVGSLEHPHVVRALDAGDDAGLPYLVMEHLAGVPLSALVGKQGVLSIADGCELVRQAALGLDAAHRRGLIHRDVKPSNLMLVPGPAAAADHGPSAGPVVKVLDLGLAIFARNSGDDEDVTVAGQVLGTLEYMAPEQRENTRRVDVRTDVYGLGATLYRLIGGRPPVDGQKLRQSAARTIHDVPPPPLRVLRPDVPLALSELVERMIAPEPDARPATAADVAQSLAPYARGSHLEELLRTFEGGSPEASRDGEARTAAWSGRRSSRSRWLASGLVLGLLVVAVVWVTITSRPGAEQGEVVLRLVPEGAVVTIDSGAADDIRRKDDGAVSILLPPGRHELVVTKGGYAPKFVPVEIAESDRVELVIRLEPLASPESDAGDSPADNERRIAEWVLQRGGEIRIFPHVVVTDAAKLPQTPFHLRIILLWEQGLHDGDLERFTSLERLEGLHVQGNPDLTDAAAEHLAPLTKLRWLYIGRSRFGDEGLAGLKGLTNLETLDLTATRVTEAGLAGMERLPKLRELYLGETSLGDAVISELDKFPELLRLDLHATAISDAGLAELGRTAPGLKYLLLRKTGVTDDALPSLKALQALKELDLRESKVTADGVARLRESLPDCRIEF